MTDRISLIKTCCKTISDVKTDARELIKTNGDDLVRLLKEYLADNNIMPGTEVKPIRVESSSQYYKDEGRLTFTDIEPCEDNPKFVFFMHKKDGTVSRRETKINFSSLKAPYLTKVS